MSKINREVVGSDGLMYDLNGLRTSAMGSTNYLGVQRRPDGMYMAAPACHDYDFATMGYANYMPPIHISESLLECAYVATEFYRDKNGNLKDLYKTKDNWGRINCNIPKFFEYEAIGGEVKGSRNKRSKRNNIITKTNPNNKTLDISTITEAANTVLRAERGAYLNKIGGMSGAIEIRDMVIAQAEFFRDVEDVYEMTTDLVVSRMAA